MNRAEGVIGHYTKYFDDYIRACGGVLQAHRPEKAEEILQYLFEKADLKSGQEVLDCGGGVGLPAAYIADKGCKVTSINITPLQIEFARENFGDLVEFKHLDFDRMEELPGVFDRILFFESIGHTKDLKKLLKSVSKKLKSNGKVYIKTPVFTDNKTHQNIADLFQYDFYDANTIASAAFEAGLLVDEISQVPFDEFDIGIYPSATMYEIGSLNKDNPETPLIKCLNLKFSKE